MSLLVHPLFTVRCFLPRILLPLSARCLSLKVGDTVTLRKKITSADIDKFAKLSGDTNPLHVDQSYIKSETSFKGCLVHGAYLNSLVSGVIGTKLPGPGTLVVKEELNFPNPCYAEQEVQVTVRLTGIRKIITVDFVCETDNGQVVLSGKAKLVLLPTVNKGC